MLIVVSLCCSASSVVDVVSVVVVAVGVVVAVAVVAAFFTAISWRCFVLFVDIFNAPKRKK